MQSGPDVTRRLSQISGDQPRLLQPAARASVHATKARARNQQRGHDAEMLVERPQLGEVVDLARAAHVGRGWQQGVLHDGAQQRRRGKPQRLARKQVEQFGVSHGCRGPGQGPRPCPHRCFRSFTTESTEATEAGRKGFRIRVQPFLSLRSVSVLSALSVVKLRTYGPCPVACPLLQAKARTGCPVLVKEHQGTGTNRNLRGESRC